MRSAAPHRSVGRASAWRCRLLTCRRFCAPTQAPVLDALHQRADELGGRFRAMNTTGKMRRIKASKQTGASAERKDAAAAVGPSHSRKASR